MTTLFYAAFTTVIVVVVIIALYISLRSIAAESLGELKCMLRYAESRLEFLNKLKEETVEIKKSKEREKIYIQKLKNEIQNHWSRKVFRKIDCSCYDILNP